MKECLSDLNFKNKPYLLTKNKTYNNIKMPLKTYATVTNMQMENAKKNNGLKRNLTSYNTKKKNNNSPAMNNKNKWINSNGKTKFQQANKAVENEYIFNLAMDNLNKYQDDIIFKNNNNNFYENNNFEKNKINYLKKNKSSEVFKNFNNISNNISNNDSTLNEKYYPGPQPEPTPIKISKNSSYYYSKTMKNYYNLNNDVKNDNNFGNSINNFYNKTLINYNVTKNNQDNNNNKNELDEQKLNFILNNLQLQNLAIIFKQNYITFDDLFLVTKEDLLEMKIPIGQRNRIIHFITEYKKVAKYYNLNELNAFFNMYKKKLLSEKLSKNNQIDNYDDKNNIITENYSSLLSSVQNLNNNINKSSITNSLSSINTNSITVNNRENGPISLKMKINRNNIGNSINHYKKIGSCNKTNNNQSFTNKNIKIENNQYYYNINNNNYCNNNRTFNKKTSSTRNKMKNNSSNNLNKKYLENYLTIPIEDSRPNKIIRFNKQLKNGNVVNTKLKCGKNGYPIRLLNTFTGNFNESSTINNATINGKTQSNYFNNSLINEFLANNTSKSENKILKNGHHYKNSKLYENFKNLNSEVENFQLRYQKMKKESNSRENKVNLLVGKQNKEKANNTLLFKESINCDKLYKLKDLKNEYMRDLKHELNK